MNAIEGVSLTEEHDGVTWAVEKSGHFTTRSMYRMLAHRGVINYQMRKIWGCRMPLKLKVFMWQIMQNKLQTGQLKKEKMEGESPVCDLCISSSNASLLDSPGLALKKPWDGIGHQQGSMIS